MTQDIVLKQFFSREALKTLIWAGFVWITLVIIKTMYNADALNKLFEMSQSTMGICLWALFGFRILDHMTGRIAVKYLHKQDPVKNPPYLSKTFVQMTVLKFSQYGVLVFGGYLIQHVGWGGSALLYSVMACIYSEAKSNLENCRKAGEAMPKPIHAILRAMEEFSVSAVKSWLNSKKK